ncbi:hypothetical protein GH714_013776 [Hevea brasiliensis]|uniref:mannosyl-glycoprotein endo-beta-N-acetylglucosaminidase n=1 Tax=Hevea brasiliensis TaxID=3981 RepID=A0A6A6N3I6_HEVBR|nr:hypothetical protein GH714_013776 [Hevea brasiliensis]
MFPRNEALSTLDPPPFDPLQPSIPISYPLKTLQELESQAYFNSFHYPFNKSSVPLKSSVLDNRPRILVCHDMQGGYVMISGSREGIMRVLMQFGIGTFITEGIDGRQTCNKLLATKESAQMYAERLRELAVDLGFDGWLGHGYYISVEGGQVSNAPWNNISSQGFQPFLEYKDNSTPDSIQVLVDFKEASYSGGVNITFKGTLKDNNDLTARLFQGKLLLGELPLHITYSVKSDGGSMLGLSLQFSSTLNERTSSVLIAPWGTNQLSNMFSKMIVPHVIRQEMAPGWVIQESIIEMNGQTLTEIHAVCYKPKPEIGRLRLENKSDGHNVTLAQNPSEYFAALGHITVKTFKDNPVFPASSSWLVEGQYIKWSPGSQGSNNLSVKITWKLEDGSNFQSSKYNIYVEKLVKTAAGNSGGRVEGTQEYIGVAYVEAFYVDNLSIPSSTSSVKFIIQVCGVDGACQNWMILHTINWMLKVDNLFLLLDEE